MKRKLLLTIESAWHLEKIDRHFLKPDFSVPLGFPAKRTEIVSVESPTGYTFEAEAEFTLSHFNISDPTAPIDQRWRVTAALVGVKSALLTQGCHLFASEELVELLTKQA